MSGQAGVLVIMGSGETAPTMAKVHRQLFARLRGESASGAPVPAVVIDTPYGFQENADELSGRTQEFFAGSVGNPVSVVTYRSREVDGYTAAAAVARISEASFVMAGPGSPSYVLRQWEDGPIPAALATHLARGGVLVMASAAALTLGVVTMPVYEIYKVGEAPRWLPGLDLLGRAAGLRAAVVPHYDNAEGGSHDTRFCYIGERRLRALEAALPEGAFVLGVDSHTALVLDLAAGSASVTGLGGVTVRVDGRSRTFEAGASFPISDLSAAAEALAHGSDVVTARSPRTAVGSLGAGAAHVGPVRQEMQDLQEAFGAALLAGDIPAAVGAILDLESAVGARVRAGEDSLDLDHAASTFRALVVRLGELAAARAGAPGAAPGSDGAGSSPTALTLDALDPVLSLVLEWRATARASKDWPAADRIRDALAAAGLEVRDGPTGSTWSVAPRA